MEDKENVVYCDVLDHPRPPALPPPRHKENVAYSDVLDVPRPPPQLPPRVQLPPETLSFRLSPPRQATISQNNNRCCRNASLSKRSMALMFAVAFFAILSTVFAMMYFTCDKKDKTSSANSSNVGNVEKSNNMNGTIEQKCNGSSGSWKYLGYGCVGAKDNQYQELPYPGPSVFIRAVKLVHTNGTVGNNPSYNSYWGGSSQYVHDLAMIVTDLKNNVIYPSRRLVTVHEGGWYNLTGYTATSPELVLSDLRNPNSLKKGGKIRIWYGEDLRDFTEWDNHGKTCMYVYVYST